ncbi:MAG: BTAD domain-containing putative transcriptional regulator [Anaerolineales bacterium]|jgi:predicted ATPase/DNA-binding SARP family transcriptional activator/predicted negative regulator of RcsB-dependent stress response
MADITIHLLGQFTVTLNGEIITNFAFDKVRALLAYLSVEAHCSHRREILANLLWPDKPEKTARSNLRNALAELRRAIGDHQAKPPFLSITRQDIRFNIDSNAWLDVVELAQLHALREANPENIKQHHRVFDLYQGELLAGFSLPDVLPFDEWVMMEREKYARMVVEILTRACAYYESRRDYKNALPFAWRFVELEPWQEGARRQLMRILANSGRRDEALQQYLILTEMLRNELDIEPEPTTVQLYERIKAGTHGGVAAFPPAEAKEIATLPDFLKEDSSAVSYLPEVFVARPKEIQQLESILDKVLAGEGGVAFVAGEAGSGKSMLIREFVRKAQLRHPDLVSATGFCNAFTGIGDPYLPFREILYQFIGDAKNQWKAGIYSREYILRLWHLLPLSCKSLLAHGTDLVDTLIPGQALLEHASPLEATDPNLYHDLWQLVERKRNQSDSAPLQANLFTQYWDVLQHVGQEKPLLIVVDDLQWADVGTISLLFHLGKHISGSRIMIVGAYRPEEVELLQGDERHPLAPILSEFKRDFGDIFINLDQAEGRDFIEGLLESEPSNLAAAFEQSLYRHTSGHPLFTVELLRYLKETGILTKDHEGRWIANSHIQLARLPPRIEGIIAERIGRLSPKLQRILTLSSIEGEAFTAEIIAEVEGIPVDHLVQMLSNQLDRQFRLVRAQRISYEGKQRISTYRFRHFLFQKYLYSRIDEIELVRLHEQVGEAMEKLLEGNTGAYAVSLSRHFHIANQIDKAVQYYQHAGERATRMCGYLEAIIHFENALKLLPELPESAARDQRELSIQLQLGMAYQATRGFAFRKAGQAYKRALELCQSLGYENAENLETLHLLFSYYSNMAEFQPAIELNSFLKTSYDEMGETISSIELILHWQRGYLDFNFGKYASAYQNFENAILAYDPDEHRSLSEMIGMEAGIYCHGWAALHGIWLGYLEKANAHFRSIQSIAELSNRKLVASDSLWFSTWILLELKDLSAARKYVDAALDIARKENYRFIESLVMVFEGRILTAEGKPEEGAAVLQKAIEMFHMAGTMTGETTWLHGLAEAYCEAGQIQEGLAVVEKIEKIGLDLGEVRHTSAVRRIKGDLYLKRGDEAAAEEYFLSAIAAAKEQSARLLELEAAKRLALLWQLQAKTRQARDMLEPVFEWFTGGFDTPMLIEARKLLEALSS